MITTSPTEFLDAHAALAPLPEAMATARAAYLIAPVGFALAARTSSATDGTGSLSGKIATTWCVLRADHGATGNL